MFPIKDYQHQIPTKGVGSFALIREEDQHTGVDLFCPEGTPVVAAEDGVVILVDDFTGIQDSEIDIKSRYLYTQVVLVEGDSGIIAYGEIVPSVKEGATVKEGDEIGHVTAVLPEDYEGPSPSRSMLHFELYDSSTEEPVDWNLGEGQPEGLLDPTDLLKRLHQGED